MKILKTAFDGIYIMDYQSYKDNRGEFVKTIHRETFESNGLESNFQESFYSISSKGVIRGMHYQTPPNDHIKLVYVIKGAIIDVVLDLRQASSSYGQYFSIELTEINRNGLYIDKGFAHGFLSLEDNTIVEYHTSTSQNKQSEAGIRYDSFGFDWNVINPIISDRDSEFKGFTEIYNPF